MTSNWQEQRMFHVWLQSGKKNGCGVAIAIALLGVLLSASTHAVAATMELPVYARDRNAVPDKVLTYLPTGAKWVVTDVDGDGRNDLIYHGASYDISHQMNPPVPVLVYHNLGNGKFELIEADQLIEGSVPNVQIARRIIAAELNGDGKLDVVVANHGLDFSPFPGEKNLLFLSRPTGGLALATTGFPVFNDFTHGVAAGDIDGDGDTDIFFGNLCCGDFPGSYFLLNDGNGNFTFDQTRIPPDFLGGNAGGANANTIISPKFIDANLDGHVDLALGLIRNDFMQTTAPGVLLLNDGTGDYSNAQPIEFPVGLFGDRNTMTLDVLSLDVNKDGLPDLILSQADKDHAGARVQTLINNGDGSFRDESFRLLTNFPYIPEIHLTIFTLEALDLNDDGHLDVLVQLEDHGTPRTTIFVNDGTGFFHRIPYDLIPNTPTAGFGPPDPFKVLDFVSLFPIRGDNGQLHFIGPEFQCNQLDPTGSLCTKATVKTSVYRPVGSRLVAFNVPLADFDGDGETDAGVYQTSSGNWFFIQSTSGFDQQLNFGGSSFLPVSGDYDGDGVTDTGVYQTTTGNWFVVGSSTGFFASALNFGGAGFIPVPGDYDGDGKSDAAVYQSSTGNWFALGSTSGFLQVLNFGGAGFVPVPGDYDGDGKIDVAVYQTSTGNWFVGGSSAGFFSPALNFGGAGFIPVPGDYDGDGKTDAAVYQSSTGNWFALRSTSGFQQVLSFGGAGFVPVAGDYDGDGKTDAAVYEQNTGNWFVLGSTTGFFSPALNFGGSGFVPVLPQVTILRALGVL